MNGDEFDLDTVNFLLRDTPSSFPPASNMSEMPNSETRVSRADELTEERKNSIQKKWHTFIEASSPAECTTPEPSQPSQPEGHIDESYRDSLQELLRPHVPDGDLPPAQFLVSILQPN